MFLEQAHQVQACCFFCENKNKQRNENKAAHGCY
jgi:hypothetical protein